MVHRDRIGKRNWQIIFKYELDRGHTASPFNASLRAVWWGGGKRKQSLQLRPWNLNSASNSTVAPRRLSCQIFVNRREAETSANVNKHLKNT